MPVRLALAGKSMKTPTRQRLIDAAVRRFYRDGFRNVGIDQILADVGISKTAFYKHFECKEDLMLAALEDNNQLMLETFRSMARERGGPTPIGQLQALLDVVEHLVESDDFQGCIFVNVAMEFPLPHEPAHIAAAKSKQAIEDMVYSLAVEAGACEPRLLAKELCLIMEGAYVTRHVTGDNQTVEIARRVAGLVIAAGCPQKSADCAT
jgi:AcrR family transcriptional regulator